MANPYYVDPMGGYGPSIVQGLTGIGQGLGEQAAAEQKSQQQQAMQRELMQAYQSEDPNQVAQVMFKYPEASQIFDSAIGFRDQATANNMVTSAKAVLANPERAEEILQSRIAMVRARGGDPSDTEEALEQYRTDPEGFMRGAEMVLASKDKPAWDAYQAQKSSGAKFTDVKIDPESNTVTFANKDTGVVESKPIDEFRPGSDLSPKQLAEFKKAEYQTANTEIKDLNKLASEIQDAAMKFRSNIDAARAGNRTAIASVIMSVAKLNSPGVVTDNDFAQMSGSQNPIGAAIGILSGKGIDPNAIIRGFDPTNPETFDAQAIETVANNLINAQVPSITKRLSGIETRMDTAGLPKKMKDTILSNTDLIKGLSNLRRRNEAPQGAIDKLMSDRSLAPAFEAKYGYLPEGF